MRKRPIVALLLFISALGGGVAACGEKKTDEPAPKNAKAPVLTTPAASSSTTSSTSTTAAEAPHDPVPAEKPYDGPYLGALYPQTPIMSDMAWPKRDEEGREKKEAGGAVRIGYIRQGQKVPVNPEVHPKSNCKEGWYELIQGGFVCGRYASLDLNHPKMRLAPHQPDLTTPLPYQYGYNVANGTPLYRSYPSREERVKLEPWLAPKPKAPPKPKVAPEETASYGDEELDAGALPLQLTSATTTVTATTTDPFGLGSEELDASTPWYLRQYDGGKPSVTLDELKGEGPVARRMVKGFFVGLDKTETNNGAKYWRTTANLYAPYERIYQHNAASKYHGVWLDEERPEAKANAEVVKKAYEDAGAPPAPSTTTKIATPDLCKPGSKSQVAIVTFYKAKKYNLSPSRKAVTTGDSLSRHTVLKLTGDTVNINGAEYAETDEGWWLKRADAVVTNPGPPPKDLAKDEKWIDVNLKSQTLVAFEGDRPVFATAVSTGKEDKTDREKDHHTPTGQFRVREKHIAATMDGDVASDGPYSIEDVPWIMYFNGSYALHGAFWHNNFGRQQSHGCVNLAPIDAKAMFGWAEPRMPEGWHGVMSTPERPGTRVIVHE